VLLPKLAGGEIVVIQIKVLNLEDKKARRMTKPIQMINQQTRRIIRE
jgi:hypothetical protein